MSKRQQYENSPNNEIRDALDSIEHSIDNAGFNQSKRQAAEELKNQYYQREINRMKDNMSNEQDNYDSPPSQQSDSDQDEYQDDHQDEDDRLDSGLKSDHQNYIISTTPNKNPLRQSDLFKPIEELDDELEQQEPSEQDLYPIKSVYQKLKEPKEPLTQTTRPSNIQQQKPIKVVKTTNSLKVKEKQKPVPIKVKLLNPSRTTLKNNKFQGETQQPQVPKKIEIQKPLRFNIKGQSQYVINDTQEKEILKENVNLGYMENTYDSDLALEHMKKQNELQYQLQIQHRLKIISIKQRTGQQLVKKKTQTNEEKKYNPRGLKDQAEINLFGQSMPCQECAVYFTQGLSSDYCGFHGKQIREIPPSQQLPRRFAKFL